MKIPLKYNINNLRARRVTTTITVLGLSLVVFTFTGVLMMTHGIREVFTAVGSDDNVVIISKGVSSEAMSAVRKEQCDIIRVLPQIATEGNKPLISIESVANIGLGNNYVTVRGVSSDTRKLRPYVGLLQGRWMESGSQELVIGRAIARRFQKTIDDKVRLGNQEWNIVGIMEADGNAVESELWGDVDRVRAVFKKTTYSTIVLRLKNAADFNAMVKEMDTRGEMLKSLEARPEKQFYQEQSAELATFIEALGLVVTFSFTLAAIIGAMITMFTAVANRTREIGTLRALGFKCSNILLAFWMESLLISVIAGVVGVGMASFLGFIEISAFNFGGFSEVSFRFMLSPEIALSALVFAIVMGVLGGLIPAIRASRLNIVASLKAL